MPHTWTVLSGTTHAEGERDTPADAWDAAHAVVADALTEHRVVDEPFRLTVDGVPSTIRPANSGDLDADIAATLEIVESGRQALVNAHRAAE